MSPSKDSASLEDATIARADSDIIEVWSAHTTNVAPHLYAASHLDGSRLTLARRHLWHHCPRLHQIARKVQGKQLLSLWLHVPSLGVVHGCARGPPQARGEFSEFEN